MNGHAGLISEISKEIQSVGPIPFARFMELALYHPQFGYYMRMEHEGAPAGVGEGRIGWDGDYYTSCDVHPILGQTLAKQIRQIDERLGHPDSFTIIEMGAGKGLLARDLLADCAAHAPDFFSRLKYMLIERSPAMRAAQGTNLDPWLGFDARVEWVDRLEDIPSASIVGVFLSNELVDAFPIHRLTVEQGHVKEVYVSHDGERFVEHAGNVSTPELLQYVDRIGLPVQTLPDGFIADINLDALTWMKEVARVMARGVVITIDYGHTAQDLYSLDRKRGTLLCYHQQFTSEDPYVRVGQQDMTAHVDFTSLAAVGEERDLHVTGFTNQMSFLMGWGVEAALSQLEPGSAEFQSIVQLLRPEGMGRTFKILIQHKGIAAPDLDGLRFKPFFGAALGKAQDTRHEAMDVSSSYSPSPLASRL